MNSRLLLMLLCFGFFSAAAQNFPKRPEPPRLVNDFTNTLSAAESSALEQKLVAYNDSTSTQIAVVILGSLEGYAIEDYTFSLGEQWGIGQKDKDNGVLMLIAIQDRKIFIGTGYGMEGVLPDGLLKRIVENDIKPAFKAGNYYQGINSGIDNIIKLAAGEYTADETAPQKAPFGIIIGVFLLIFAVIVMIKVRSVREYAAVNSIPYWTAWQLLNQSRNVHPGSWGGFSGGSSWGGGGGGGGGGFGGFGGGSFGGGGAGGSW
jgi:uncharacterized protein